MSEKSLNLVCQTVGNKSTDNNCEHDEKATEIISTSTKSTEIQFGAEEKHILRQFFFNQRTALIVLGILGLFLILTNVCVPLKQIKNVVVNSDETSFNNCSDRESCLAFVDVIERKHDGLEYNFVIGQRGELYIGAGFQCQIYSYVDCPLYVKLLRARDPDRQYTEAQCSRLAEIINHGKACGKLSQDLQIMDETNICNNLLVSQKRSYNVHDPDHFVKLLLRDFSWTSCGNFSSTENIKRERIVTLESSSNNTCLPLNLANEVIVDIHESDDTLDGCEENETECIKDFEQRQDGLKYNFIIDSNVQLYIGRGFNCKIDRDDKKALKIKILSEIYTWSVYSQWRRYLEILLEGIACGQIEEKFSVRYDCHRVTFEFAMHDPCCWKSRHNCVFRFKSYQDYDSIKQVDPNYFALHENLTITPGRVVFNDQNYRFCPRYYKDTQVETTTPSIEDTTKPCSQLYWGGVGEVPVCVG